VAALNAVAAFAALPGGPELRALSSAAGVAGGDEVDRALHRATAGLHRLRRQVKRFGAAGSVGGEDRFLGLVTPPRTAPTLATSRCCGARWPRVERAGFTPGQFNAGKAGINNSRNLSARRGCFRQQRQPLQTDGRHPDTWRAPAFRLYRARYPFERFCTA